MAEATVEAMVEATAMVVAKVGGAKDLLAKTQRGWTWIVSANRGVAVAVDVCLKSLIFCWSKICVKTMNQHQHRRHYGKLSALLIRQAVVEGKAGGHHSLCWVKLGGTWGRVEFLHGAGAGAGPFFIWFGNVFSCQAFSSKCIVLISYGVQKGCLKAARGRTLHEASAFMQNCLVSREITGSVQQSKKCVIHTHATILHISYI